MIFFVIKVKRSIFFRNFLPSLLLITSLLLSSCDSGCIESTDDGNSSNSEKNIASAIVYPISKDVINESNEDIEFGVTSFKIKSGITEKEATENSWVDFSIVSLSDQEKNPPSGMKFAVYKGKSFKIGVRGSVNLKGYKKESRVTTRKYKGIIPIQYSGITVSGGSTFSLDIKGSSDENARKHETLVLSHTPNPGVVNSYNTPLNDGLGLFVMLVPIKGKNIEMQSDYRKWACNVGLMSYEKLKEGGFVASKNWGESAGMSYVKGVDEDEMKVFIKSNMIYRPDSSLYNADEQKIDHIMRACRVNLFKNVAHKLSFTGVETNSISDDDVDPKIKTSVLSSQGEFLKALNNRVQNKNHVYGTSGKPHYIDGISGLGHNKSIIEPGTYGLYHVMSPYFVKKANKDEEIYIQPSPWLNTPFFQMCTDDYLDNNGWLSSNDLNSPSFQENPMSGFYFSERTCSQLKTDMNIDETSSLVGGLLTFSSSGYNKTHWVYGNPDSMFHSDDVDEYFPDEKIKGNYDFRFGARTNFLLSRSRKLIDHEPEHLKEKLQEKENVTGERHYSIYEKGNTGYGLGKDNRRDLVSGKYGGKSRNFNNNKSRRFSMDTITHNYNDAFFAVIKNPAAYATAVTATCGSLAVPLCTYAGPFFFPACYASMFVTCMTISNLEINKTDGNFAKYFPGGLVYHHDYENVTSYNAYDEVMIRKPFLTTGMRDRWGVGNIGDRVFGGGNTESRYDSPHPTVLNFPGMCLVPSKVTIAKIKDKVKNEAKGETDDDINESIRSGFLNYFFSPSDPFEGQDYYKSGIKKYNNEYPDPADSNKNVIYRESDQYGFFSKIYDNQWSNSNPSFDFGDEIDHIVPFVGNQSEFIARFNQTFDNRNDYINGWLRSGSKRQFDSRGDVNTSNLLSSFGRNNAITGCLKPYYRAFENMEEMDFESVYSCDINGSHNDTKCYIAKQTYDKDKFNNFIKDVYFKISGNGDQMTDEEKEVLRQEYLDAKNNFTQLLPEKNLRKNELDEAIATINYRKANGQIFYDQELADDYQRQIDENQIDDFNGEIDVNIRKESMLRYIKFVKDKPYVNVAEFDTAEQLGDNTYINNSEYEVFLNIGIVNRDTELNVINDELENYQDEIDRYDMLINALSGEDSNIDSNFKNILSFMRSDDFLKIKKEEKKINVCYNDSLKLKFPLQYVILKSLTNVGNSLYKPQNGLISLDVNGSRFINNKSIGYEKWNELGLFKNGDQLKFSGANGSDLNASNNALISRSINIGSDADHLKPLILNNDGSINKSIKTIKKNFPVSLAFSVVPIPNVSCIKGYSVGCSNERINLFSVENGFVNEEIMKNNCGIGGVANLSKPYGACHIVKNEGNKRQLSFIDKLESNKSYFNVEYLDTITPYNNVYEDFHEDMCGYCFRKDVNKNSDYYNSNDVLVFNTNDKVNYNKDIFPFTLGQSVSDSVINEASCIEAGHYWATNFILVSANGARDSYKFEFDKNIYTRMCLDGYEQVSEDVDYEGKTIKLHSLVNFGQNKYIENEIGEKFYYGSVSHGQVIKIPKDIDRAALFFGIAGEGNDIEKMHDIFPENQTYYDSSYKVNLFNSSNQYPLSYNDIKNRCISSGNYSNDDDGWRKAHEYYQASSLSNSYLENEEEIMKNRFLDLSLSNSTDVEGGKYMFLYIQEFNKDSENRYINQLNPSKHPDIVFSPNYYSLQENGQSYYDFVFEKIQDYIKEGSAFYLENANVDGEGDSLGELTYKITPKISGKLWGIILDPSVKKNNSIDHDGRAIVFVDDSEGKISSPTAFSVDYSKKTTNSNVQNYNTGFYSLTLNQNPSDANDIHTASIKDEKSYSSSSIINKLIQLPFKLGKYILYGPPSEKVSCKRYIKSSGNESIFHQQSLSTSQLKETVSTKNDNSIYTDSNVCSGNVSNFSKKYLKDITSTELVGKHKFVCDSKNYYKLCKDYAKVNLDFNSHSFLKEKKTKSENVWVKKNTIDIRDNRYYYYISFRYDPYEDGDITDKHGNQTQYNGGSITNCKKNTAASAFKIKINSYSTVDNVIEFDQSLKDKCLDDVNYCDNAFLLKNKEKNYFSTDNIIYQNKNYSNPIKRNNFSIEGINGFNENDAYSYVCGSGNVGKFGNPEGTKYFDQDGKWPRLESNDKGYFYHYQPSCDYDFCHIKLYNRTQWIWDHEDNFYYRYQYVLTNNPNLQDTIASSRIKYGDSSIKLIDDIKYKLANINLLGLGDNEKISLCAANQIGFNDYNINYKTLLVDNNTDNKMDILGCGTQNHYIFTDDRFTGSDNEFDYLGTTAYTSPPASQDINKLNDSLGYKTYIFPQNFYDPTDITINDRKNQNRLNVRKIYSYQKDSIIWNKNSNANGYDEYYMTYPFSQYSDSKLNKSIQYIFKGYKLIDSKEQCFDHGLRNINGDTYLDRNEYYDKYNFSDNTELYSPSSAIFYYYTQSLQFDLATQQEDYLAGFTIANTDDASSKSGKTNYCYWKNEDNDKIISPYYLPDDLMIEKYGNCSEIDESNNKIKTCGIYRMLRESEISKNDNYDFQLCLDEPYSNSFCWRFLRNEPLEYPNYHIIENDFRLGKNVPALSSGEYRKEYKDCSMKTDSVQSCTIIRRNFNHQGIVKDIYTEYDVITPLSKTSGMDVYYLSENQINGMDHIESVTDECIIPESSGKNISNINIDEDALNYNLGKNQSKDIKICTSTRVCSNNLDIISNIEDRQDVAVASVSTTISKPEYNEYCSYKRQWDQGLVYMLYKNTVKNPIIYACFYLLLILHIMNYGYKIFSGKAKVTLEEISEEFYRVLIFFLIAMPNSWDIYSKFVIQNIVEGTDKLTAFTLSAFTGSDPNIGIEEAGFGDLVDKLFTDIIFSDTFWKRISSFIFVGFPAGIILTYGLLIAISNYIMVVFQATLVYLYCLFKVGLYLALGPFLLILSMSEYTKGFYKKWLSNVLKTSLSQFLISFGVSIICFVVYNLLKSINNIRICFKAILKIPILNIPILSWWTPSVLPTYVVRYLGVSGTGFSSNYDISFVSIFVILLLIFCMSEIFSIFMSIIEDFVDDKELSKISKTGSSFFSKLQGGAEKKLKESNDKADKADKEQKENRKGSEGAAGGNDSDGYATADKGGDVSSGATDGASNAAAESAGGDVADAAKAASDAQ